MAIDALQPHLLAVALICARLIPVTFLCPLLGGSHAPTHVKLGWPALGIFLHGPGLEAPSGQTLPSTSQAWSYRSSSLGPRWVFWLPSFDAAWRPDIDLFRGSSAGRRSHGRHQGSRDGRRLLPPAAALGSAGALLPLMLAALSKSGLV